MTIEVTENRCLKVLIADDELLLAKDLRDRLIALSSAVEVVGMAGDGFEALEMIAAHKPDVVFLDIRMPGMSGIEIASRIAHPCSVVFVTAYDQYALEAFDTGAVDYLLKPIEEARLTKTLKRLTDRAFSEGQSLEDPETGDDVDEASDCNPIRWIRGSVGNDVRLLPVKEVMYFQALNKYTAVETTSGQLLIRLPIRELLSRLDPNVFRQIHRGTIVNLHWVELVRHDTSGRLTIGIRGRDERLHVSRAFASEFKPM